MFYLNFFSRYFSQVILASHEDRYEAQHQAVVVISTLIEFDENWIADQTELIATLKSIWESDLYKVRVLHLRNCFSYQKPLLMYASTRRYDE